MQLLSFLLIYPWLWLLSLLPMRVLYILSDFCYLLLYKIFGYRKKVVSENLKLAFPDKSAHERALIEKRFFHHLTDLLFEFVKSLTISEKEMKRRMTFKNLEVIQDAYNQGQHVNLVCGHYGGWEWMFILDEFISHHSIAIYKKLNNKYFDRMVKRIRARYNTLLVPTTEALALIAKRVESSQLTFCAFNADQSPNPRKARYWRSFMGIETPVHTSAEMLAKKYNMAVIFLDIHKQKRGYYEARFELISNTPAEFADYDITDIFFEKLEQQIYRDPAYYLWSHRRWKHRRENFA
jgi:Kdo2-lipid IVA lauroyltransferase/acyltransferase